MNKLDMTFRKLFIQSLPIVVVFMLVEQFWLNKGQNVWMTILGGVIFFIVYFAFMCWVHGLIPKKKG